MSDLNGLLAKLDRSPEMKNKITAGLLAEALAEAQMAPPRKDPFRWFDRMQEVTSSPYLVKGVLPAGCLAVIFGESGSGKTFFASDLALHIAAELRWRDKRTNGGLVIYVAAEAAGSVSARVAAWRKANPLISSAPFAVLPGAINLMHRQSVDGLIADILEAAERLKVKPALVVFDTFARCIAGADENSAADVGEAVAACDEIRAATEATVAVVHHSGKDVARGARGSSALRAAVDVEISVEGLTGTRTATVTKSRDGETGERFAFDLEPVPLGINADGDPVSSLIVRPVNNAPAKPMGVGKNQTTAMVALKEWTRTKDNTHITSAELVELLKGQGIRDRRRRAETVAFLTQAGILAPAIGGHTINREAL